MNFYTRVDSQPIKGSTAAEFVLDFLALQEALLKPLLVNASAGGQTGNTDTSVAPPLTGGRCLTLLFKRPNSFVFVVLCLKG